VARYESTRRLRCDGSDNEYSYWSTPSWTGAKIIYTITINKDTREVRCSCMDAQCRRHFGELDDPTIGCKHTRALVALVHRRVGAMNRRRDAHAWRKCYLCGQFISMADLEHAVTTDPTGVTDFEPRDPIFAHRTCANQLKENQPCQPQN
jgi:hypothetical protein